MVQKLKVSFVFLLGFSALFVAPQQGFSYQHQNKGLLPPWALLDKMSDIDLYSYILARRLALPYNSPFISSYINTARHNPLISTNSPSMTIPVEEPADIYSSRTEGGMIGEQDIEVWSRNSFADLSRSKQTLEEAHQPINPRFFSYLNNVAFPNSYPFIKTAYYLTTTTTTATEIVTCLSTAIFSVPASSLWTVICRKRRDIVELFEGLKSLDEEEESIIPSKLQPVVPTASPSPTTFYDVQSSPYISSSKHEDVPSSVEPVESERWLRPKRLVGLFYSTTFVTSYIFSTITSTRTLSSNFGTSLKCRPSQFTYC